MPRATYPAVVRDENSGQYRCEMRDKRTGRVWGYGYGATRHEAIQAAAIEQPPSNAIKRAIGWVRRYPFWAGAAVGCFLRYRQARNHQETLRLRDYLVPAIAVGTIAWGVSKITEYVNKRRHQKEVAQ